MSGWVTGAIAVGVGSIGGALISANAAKQAAKGQANAAKYATDQAMSAEQQARKDREPWRQAGLTALGQLGDLTKTGGDLNRRFTLADFIKDPGYDFRMSEGAKAIERSAAARGGVLGGGTLKALTRYNQEFASNEYGTAFGRWNQENNQQFGRLASIAGLGQQANSENAQGGQWAARIAGESAIGASNAAAAAQIAQGNAVKNGINSGMNAWMLAKK